MLQLTPQTIRIIDSYDDGEDAKLYTFEPIGFEHKQTAVLGQFFMLTVPGMGQAPFTYVSLPDQKGRFVALIRKVGKLTKALFTLKKGAVLGYNGPYGLGWPIDKLVDTEVLIVAGGCGLAPVAATIDHLIENGQAKQTTVVYGAKDTNSQILRKHRAKWESKIVLIETLLRGQDTLHKGTPSDYIASTYKNSNKPPQIVLTCGPQEMMKSVAKTCIDLEIDSDKIWLSLEKRMRCGVGLCGHCYLADNLICKQGPTYCYEEYLQLENKTTRFPAHTGLFTYC